jgi:hypothetical protein
MNIQTNIQRRQQLNKLMKQLEQHKKHISAHKKHTQPRVKEFIVQQEPVQEVVHQEVVQEIVQEEVVHQGVVQVEEIVFPSIQEVIKKYNNISDNSIVDVIICDNNGCKSIFELRNEFNINCDTQPIVDNFDNNIIEQEYENEIIVDTMYI